MSNRIRSGVQRLPRPKLYWIWAILLFAIPVLGLVLSIVFWDWLSFDESRGTTIRNIGLIIAAITALPLAIWRGLVAEKQAGSAQQSLRNERYQKGAEMLGHDALSVRLGGIYALQRLSNEHPEEYHVQIMRLLCAFARHPTSYEKHVKEVTSKFGLSQIREDVQAITSIIGKRGSEEVNLERMQDFNPNLEHAYMSFAELSEANFENAQLGHADLLAATLTKGNLSNIVGIEVNLEDVSLSQSTLSNARISWANLANADLTKADLSRALLLGANLLGSCLSGANLSRVSGLTQGQLNQARADPNNPPRLDGALDSETGQPLVWRGGSAPPLLDGD